MTIRAPMPAGWNRDVAKEVVQQTVGLIAYNGAHSSFVEQGSCWRSAILPIPLRILASFWLNCSARTRSEGATLKDYWSVEIALMSCWASGRELCSSGGSVSYVYVATAIGEPVWFKA